MRNVFQNLTGAFVYNVLGLQVALGVLCPFFGVLLSPLLTALAMSFSSVTVISNASSDSSAGGRQPGIGRPSMWWASG